MQKAELLFAGSSDTNPTVYHKFPQLWTGSVSFEGLTPLIHAHTPRFPVRTHDCVSRGLKIVHSDDFFAIIVLNVRVQGCSHISRVTGIGELRAMLRNSLVLSFKILNPLHNCRLSKRFPLVCVPLPTLSRARLEGHAYLVVILFFFFPTVSQVFVLLRSALA